MADRSMSLHLYDLAEIAEGCLDGGVRITKRGPLNGMFQELTRKGCLGSEAGVTTEGRLLITGFVVGGGGRCGDAASGARGVNWLSMFGRAQLGCG